MDVGRRVLRSPELREAGTVNTDDAEPPSDSAPTEAAPREPAAWRLTFEYEGDSVRLVGRQPVSMLAPVDDAELLARGQEGYWIEVRDEGGRPLYQQVLHQPLQTHYEVFSPEPGVRPHLVPNPDVRGAFSAVVPDLPDGAVVVVQGPPVTDDTDDDEPPAPSPVSRRQKRKTARQEGDQPRTLVSAPLRHPKKGKGRGPG